MRFLKGSVWSSGLIVTKAFSSFAVNKFIATQYGLSGITFLAHFQNFIALFLTIPQDGINVGVIKYLSDETMADDQRKRYFFAGLALNGTVFLLSLVAIAIGGGYLTDLLVEEMRSLPWLLLLGLSILLQLANFFFLSVLLANRRLKTYVLLSIGNAFILIASVAVFSGLVPFSYLLLIVGIAPTLLFPLAAISAFRTMGERLSGIRLNITRSTVSHLTKFIAMAMAIAISGRAVDFLIREYSISTFDAYNTGMWQAVVRLSDLYTGGFVALIGMVYYPRVARYINRPAELRGTVFRLFWYSAPLFAGGLFLIYLVREPLLRLLFASEFEEASFLIDFQLIGDFLKLQSYWLAYLITAQARTRLFIASQFISSGVYVLLIFWATDIYGLEGFTIAQAIRYAGYLIFVMILYRKLIF